MVTVAKAKIKVLQDKGEEEESSEDKTKITDRHGSKITLEPDMSQGSASRDMCKPQTPQYIFEELEEDSDDSDNSDEIDETRSNPSMGEQDSHKDAQAIVTQMLKDLHHGNGPNADGHLHSTDSALDLLQDHVTLQKARVDIVAIAKESSPATSFGVASWP
ncbi:hypothetical protein H4582DRAFT_2071547 [Lactarius indigo]|nr:hypothetical protein H4582DRAFT_2071547 [Lactarius indigo]